MFSLYIGLVHPRSNRASSIRFDSRSSIYNFRTPAPAWTGWLVHHELFVNTGSPFETHACVYSRRWNSFPYFPSECEFFRRSISPNIYSFLILFYFPAQLSCILCVTPFFSIYIHRIILNGSIIQREKEKAKTKMDNLFIRISSHFFIREWASRHHRRTRSVEFYFRIARSPPTLVFSPNTNSGP